MKKIISGSTLKILAMIFMVIDHFGQVVLKNGIILHAPYSMFTDEQFDMLMSTVNICHILGRIAFPVFCFLLVEGFFHTHNLKKYILNLGIFALISEPVYDLACATLIRAHCMRCGTSALWTTKKYLHSKFLWAVWKSFPQWQSAMH